MRKIFFSAYIFGILLLAASCQSGQQEQTEKPGQAAPAGNDVVVREQPDGAFLFTYEGMELVVDPAYGGRHMSLKLRGQEIFSTRSESMNATQFYGSVLWPSPQMSWNMWPPPYELDLAPYTAEVKEKALHLTSAMDDTLHVRFEKIVAIDKTHRAIQTTYRAVNMDTVPVQLGLWEVTRMPKGGMAIFPAGHFLPDSLSGNEHFPQGWYYVETQGQMLPNTKVIDGIFWENIPEGTNGIQKLMADGQEGWSAYIRNRIAFIKAFPEVPMQELPPFHGEVEVMIADDVNYIELEQHSDYRTISPAESTEWTVKWYVEKLPENIKLESGNEEVVGFIRQVIAPQP